MLDRLKFKAKMIWRNDFWKKLAKNVSTVIAGNGGSAVLNFLLTVVMVRALGNTNYGIFLIALQYMNLIDGIINFQSWAGVIKYGSEALVDNDETRLCSVIKSGFIIDISTSFLGTIIALAILPIAAKLAGWSENLNILIFLFSLEIVFHIEGTSVGILRLFDKFRFTAIQSVLGALIKLILIGGYFIIGGKSLIVITIIYVIADIFKHLLLVVMAVVVLISSVGIKKVLKTRINKKRISPFFSYTIWNNICYTMDVPVKYFDVFIISLISVEMVSIYKVFQQIFQALSMITTPISTAILPQFSELVAKNRLVEAYKKMLKIRNVFLLVSLGIIVISLPLAKPLLDIVFGKEYGQQIILFMVMLVMNLFFTSYVSIHSLMQGLGKAKVDMMITLFGNIAYCVFAYLLVRRIGIYSVIAAKAAGSLIVIYGKKIYIRKQIKEGGI